MWNGIAADFIVTVHLLFVLFVVCGGLLALRWRWISLVHLPAAIWGVVIEFTGWMCPLTPLEIRLRVAAGEEGYPGGFVEHYLISLLYPHALTRSAQVILGIGVLVFNAVVYSRVFATRESRT